MRICEWEVAGAWCQAKIEGPDLMTKDFHLICTGRLEAPGVCPPGTLVLKETEVKARRARLGQ